MYPLPRGTAHGHRQRKIGSQLTCIVNSMVFFPPKIHRAMLLSLSEPRALSILSIPCLGAFIRMVSYNLCAQ